MVDKIKALGITPEPIEVKNARSALTGASTQNLKENFKSISSSLSAAQVFKGSNNTQKEKVNSSSSSRLSDSLQDAVKYSKQALKVLEDVTAGGLNSEGVGKLLSEESESDEVSLPDRERLPVTVQQLAGDLEDLKNNLTTLFESLKQKANQSVVSNENQLASQVNTQDLEQARSKAKSTSLQIQFNGNEALSAHRGLTLDSVAFLLSSREAGKI
jgi:hypothetical protein